MGTLYIVAAQPNPVGKDRSDAVGLNQEWVEFQVAGGDRNLAGDELSHLTFGPYGCSVTGEALLERFILGTLSAGRIVRVHTGPGQDYWDGTRLHHFLNRNWYVWNNACGDRATLSYNGSVIDWAAYGPNPPQGILIRVPGTNVLR